MFFEVANRLLSPVMAGIMVAAVLSAIMSTADSQLLVAASSVSHDWRLSRGQRTDLKLSRLVVLGVSLVATLLAMFAPDAIFSTISEIAASFSGPRDGALAFLPRGAILAYRPKLLAPSS